MLLVCINDKKNSLYWECDFLIFVQLFVPLNKVWADNQNHLGWALLYWTKKKEKDIQTSMILTHKEQIIKSSQAL